MSETADYQDAAIELGKAIAIGAVPVLGQAIDLYDTIESALALYQAQTEEDKDNAKFDFVLAIIGWIPGPGDGVKKSLRIVNKDPQRYAPILFDLLRRVLHLAGIETSPEALLQGIFDSGHLQAQMATIKQSVRGYGPYQALPQTVQAAVMTMLDLAEAQMPQMVGVVERRLLKWKRAQRNSSAREPTQSRARQEKPGKQEAQVHKEGKDGAAHGHAGEAVNATLAEKGLHELTNEIVGISGEHIADYICAYTYHWGTDWQRHDDGAQGRWSEGAPGKDKLGKLSKGGSPKEAHALYKLDDGPNGTGIDAVWRASGRNGGKPYAIVEAKASKDEDGPKFAKLPGSTRKPSIKSLLKHNAPDLNPKAEDLLEPMLDEEKAGANLAKPTGGPARPGARPGGSPGAGQRTPKGATQRQGAATSTGTGGKQPVILVQMSHEWIQENLLRCVGGSLRDEILTQGYARHLFYAPYWHPSGSPKAHMEARRTTGQAASIHAAHDAYHYDDAAVKTASNHRKARLRAKYGSFPSLKGEL